ncbi:MAG: hypothetical protein ABH850_03505 [Candidatus Micrarchaeota archaeon]
MKKVLIGILFISLAIVLTGCAEGPEGQAIKPITTTKTLTETEINEILKDATDITPLGEMTTTTKTENGITTTIKTQQYSYHSGPGGGTTTISCSGSCSYGSDGSACVMTGCDPRSYYNWKTGVTTWSCSSCSCSPYGSCPGTCSCNLAGSMDR